MHLGFSYVGLIFLLMLFLPNLLWTKNQPKDYEIYAMGEHPALLALERIGEVLVTCFVLCFSDFNVRKECWALWLLLALALMVLYEVYWIKYFRSKKTMQDFYSNLAGIPVAGATLPVLAVLALAVYGRNPLLLVSGVILGIGHIGIHLQHQKESPSKETFS